MGWRDGHRLPEVPTPSPSGCPSVCSGWGTVVALPDVLPRSPSVCSSVCSGWRTVVVFLKFLPFPQVYAPLCALVEGQLLPGTHIDHVFTPYKCQRVCPVLKFDTTHIDRVFIPYSISVFASSWRFCSRRVISMLTIVRKLCVLPYVHVPRVIARCYFYRLKYFIPNQPGAASTWWFGYLGMYL